VQNAIDFAHIMGIPEPKVAILAGIDTVTPKMRATLLGARVPIVLANRNDPIESRVASLVLSLLAANHLRAPR